MGQRVALLGATSHMAKGLIGNFCRAGRVELFLFARDMDKTRDFLRGIGAGRGIHVKSVEAFGQDRYDVVINCIGIGSPRILGQAGASIFTLTETYDDLVLGYLRKHPKALYINFSSGAVYGNSFHAPVTKKTPCGFSVNDLSAKDYYGIAKLNAEAKHRAAGALHIVDIRAFSYFSRFIDLDSGYFLTDMIRCLKAGQEFVTDGSDFVRDYLHPADLYRLVGGIMEAKRFNGVLDAYSRKPVSKSAILTYFKKAYGLRCRLAGKLRAISPTGEKSFYCSLSREAARLGYKPGFSSLETIAEESKYLLKMP